MNSLQMASRLTPQVVRTLTTTARRQSVSMKEAFGSTANKGTVPTSAGYQRVRALQNEFNSNPELMVWQKRGLRDTMPMAMTMVISFVGIGLLFSNLYDMSFPKN